jgi:hypothetical protein
MNRILAVAALAALLALPACSREPEAPPKTVPGTSADSPLLAYVPAETPYFWANRLALTPEVSLELMRRGGFDPEVAKGNFADVRRDMGDEDGRAFALLEALIDEMGDLREAESYARLGLSPNPHYALYGVGLVPVARLQIVDAERFGAFIERLLAILELEVQRSDTEAGKLWRLAVDQAQVRLLVSADQAVLSAARAEVSEESLRLLMGLERPTRSLADSGELIELEQRHGFTPHGSGRLDLARLLAEIRQPSNALGRELFPEVVLEGACREELEGVARRFPGLALGTRKLDLEGIEAALIVLTDAELAADLATLPAPVPGMGRPQGLVSLGFGIQLPRLTTLLGRWASALSSAPYRCDPISALNETAGGMRQAAANPALLMAAPAVSGLMLRLDRLDVGDLEHPDFAGVGVLASPSPQGLVAMGGAFLPPLAGLGLAPGDEARPLPADLIQGPLRSAWVALSERAIAMAFNADGQAAKSALAAPDSPADLLLYLHFQSEMYRSFGKVMARAGGDDPQAQRMGAEFERYADLYDYSDFWLRTGPHGVEIGFGSRFR